MMLHNEDAAYPTEADAEILGSGKFLSIFPFFSPFLKQKLLQEHSLVSWL